jgi:hypothetical protein
MCLTECRVMKTYPLLNYAPRHEGMWGSGDIAPLIRNLGTRWGWVVSFTRRPLYPQGKASVTHLIGDWVGRRVDVDAMAKRKIAAFLGSRTPVVQPVAKTID